MTNWHQAAMDASAELDKITDRLDTWLANSHKSTDPEPIKAILRDLLATMNGLPKPADSTDIALYVQPGSAEVWVVFPGDQGVMRTWRLACGSRRNPLLVQGSEHRDLTLAQALLEAAQHEVIETESELNAAKAGHR